METERIDILPYGRHLIEQDDVEAVTEVLRGDWLTQGPKVAELEKRLAARCGARYGVACNSGTAALHLALLAARVGSGDEIVGPAVSFMATSNCGIYVGATPRFCDVDFPSVRMTVELLAPALSARTRAVLPVHFAGMACDMPAISRAVRSRCSDAVIIEDACHALGGVHDDGTPIGSLRWADMVMFSFHPVKHVAAGEGGIILTDREDLAERLARLRNHGMTKDPGQLTRPDEGPWYYEMHEVGFNFRIPDLNCALVLSQLGKLDRFLDRRREIAARYHQAFAELPHATAPSPSDAAASAWHIYALHVDFEALGRSRREIVGELGERGVGTQVHYYPVPLQPYYRQRWGYVEGDFPGAERHYAQALTIPLFPAMSNDDVERVIATLHAVLGSAG